MILTWPIWRQEPPFPPLNSQPGGVRTAGRKATAHLQTQRFHHQPIPGWCPTRKPETPKGSEWHLSQPVRTAAAEGVGSEAANSIEVVVVRRGEDACERA